MRLCDGLKCTVSNLYVFMDIIKYNCCPFDLTDGLVREEVKGKLVLCAQCVVSCIQVCSG